ncbi:MAG: YcgN family cysteine cluster protein [Deltaproteobacteria bacterium]
MDKIGSDPEKWESLCNQCGTCCFEKIENDNGTIFFTQTPCRYLDVVTRSCRIYSRRSEINPDCIQLTESLVRELSWLHNDCAYKKAFGSTNGVGKTRQTK